MNLLLLLLIWIFATTSVFSQTYRSAFDLVDADLYDGQGKTFTSNTGNSVTIEVGFLEAYITMYKATKDRHYLDKFIIQAHRTQRHRDDNINNYSFEVAGSTCPKISAIPQYPAGKAWSTDDDEDELCDCLD